jgi:hypothetical protein
MRLQGSILAVSNNANPYMASKYRLNHSSYDNGKSRFKDQTKMGIVALTLVDDNTWGNEAGLYVYST